MKTRIENEGTVGMIEKSCLLCLQKYKYSKHSYWILFGGLSNPIAEQKF